jgi:hypothetical protein
MTRRVIPEPAVADWIRSLVPWMDAALDVRARHGTIVLPTEDDFPVDDSLEGIALAEDYLAFVLEHAGMSERRFAVLEQEERGAGAALRGMVHAMTPEITRGTAAPVDRSKPLPIRVLAETCGDAPRLVAVLGRGVAHYRAQEARTPPPGPETMGRAVVDVLTVFLGFGVFLANASHRAGGFERGGLVGFSVQRLGELGPIEVAYALALRATLIGADTKEIASHLRENPRAAFSAALRELEKHPMDDLALGARTPYR